MNYWVDGCTSRKCQERGRLVINHFKGVAFCFLMPLLFYVFLLFACYGIWGVVFHGMLAPRSDVVGGMLFIGFLLFGDV
jgi:hypothetical protein